MRKILIIFGIVILSLTSCTHSIKFGMIGTRNIDYSSTYEKGDITLANNEVMILLIIPIMKDMLHPMEVIDVALEKGGYDFLTDAEISQTVFFTYIINYIAVEVKGTGWKNANSAFGYDMNNKIFLVSEDGNQISLTSDIPDEILNEYYSAIQ